MTTEARPRVRLFFPPVTIILVCIPLILGMIPRNGIYGVRTRAAMASDAAWYAVNRSGGIVLIGASAVWLVAAAYAPPRYVPVIGIAAVLLAFLIIRSLG